MKKKIDEKKDYMADMIERLCKELPKTLAYKIIKEVTNQHLIILQDIYSIEIKKIHFEEFSRNTTIAILKNFEKNNLVIKERLPK